MNRITDTLRTFNKDWNDLPRRILWIVVMIGCASLLFLVFPYVAPFAFAALFSWMIDPIVRFITKLLGGTRLIRGIVVGALVSLLIGIIMLLLLLLSGQVLEEIKSLATTLPKWISDVTTSLDQWVNSLNLDFGILEKELQEALSRLVTELSVTLTTLTSQIASAVARTALRTAGLLPKGILFIVLTLMGTFYMSADRARIFVFLKGLLPEKYQKQSTIVRTSILKAVFSQLRATMIMMGVIFTLISVGFIIMGIDYAILFAMIIAVLDALPVVGAGLFLIPMFIYGIAMGNALLAVGSALLYLATIFLRQLLEPRIIGRQLGLYPLATMMAMYAGLHALGFLGMLVGPLILLLCKVVFTAK